MQIERLTEASEESLKDINKLIYQLSPRLPACSIELLEKIVADSNTELWVARDEDSIVGMATLAVVLLPEGERAQMEDIVVDEKCRGQGLGEKLCTKIVERARERNISTMTLSSRADRVAANKLYQKLGFTQRETNLYTLKL